MHDAQTDFDAVILGGGPAGATAGIELARSGRRVLLLEKQVFPRFHVGESMMPVGRDMIHRLGLADQLATLPQVPKHGAEFGFPGTPDDETLRFAFTQSLSEGPIVSMNIERSHHDKMLLDAAREAGCDVREGVRVEAIERLAHHDVAVRVGGEVVRAKWLLDASGQATVVAKHLGTKRGIPSLRNTAFFGHFTGVERLRGDEEGYPTIVMFDEGWFWIIPINDTVTSCGLVMHQDAVKRAGVPSRQMLRWAVERCPLVARRMRDATFPETSHCVSDYSYRCEPYAGPGFFLVGDAATFVDPIFSTGVALGMASGIEAAKLIGAIDTGTLTPQAAQKRYIRFVKGSTKLLFELVHNYYDHSFRELMMNGTGPAQMHRAVISLLAGHVFPRPAWRLAWRLRLMQFNARLQRYVSLVPRHATYSLFDAVANPMRETDAETHAEHEAKEHRAMTSSA